MAQSTLEAVGENVVEEEERRIETAGRMRRFRVDLWATSLNDVEIGVYQHSRHRAKSSQFTKDMDVIGQVTEEGERTGLLAYRKGLWRENVGVNKRLVVKLFSSKMNWRGTLDMMAARSLQLTHGAGGMPVTAFALNLARHEQNIQLERSAYKLPFMPEKFSFFILGDEGPRYYKLRQNLISIGRDYSLYDDRNRRIGYLDNKVMDVGGVWHVSLEKAHATPKLEAALHLFCAMLRFNKSARAHVRALWREMRAGRLERPLDRHEEELYMNPRRTR